MQLNERIEVLIKLGELLSQPNEYLEAIQHRTYHTNNWFTVENQQKAIAALVQEFLQKDKLEQWLSNYPNLKDPKTPKRVGLIPAGNIPLVGFHDILCIFISGHHTVIRPSEKEKFLTPYILKALGDIDERTKAYFTIVPKVQKVDAMIATGSNNSSRYFEAYFGKYPNIIRKNRNAVAILNGTESHEELTALGTDVFQYFGLGCRNVSKLYLPREYNFEPLLEALHEHRKVVLHNKYKNNFDYNYAMLMINKEPFKANGCIILKEDPAFTSRIASLHYEFYDDLNPLKVNLESQQEAIQCLIAKPDLLDLPTINFGEAQRPGLADYADGVDTLKFLIKL